MLYLIKPNGTMVWSDFPAKATIRLAVEHERDLSQLDWQVADNPADQLVVELALRYGVKCEGGIVLDAEYVVQRRRPLEIAQAHQQAARSQEAIRTSTGPLMEQLLPGWTDNGRELDESVDESNLRAIEDAEAELAQTLAAKDVDPDLVSHWTGLGGSVPGK